ncbi:Alpha/Beta hydrolase fold [Trichophyton rubrum]|nr:Alpha/Beta hydrolase fold [Trichophyton rubrum]
MAKYDFVMLWILTLTTAIAAARPMVVDKGRQITYTGLDRNGIEVFLGIPFGHDTGGKNRFKPPVAVVPPRGSNVNATVYGPICPQELRAGSQGKLVISENCLNLNIGRPKNMTSHEKLAVMVTIYGGGYWVGHNQDPRWHADNMVKESVANGRPIIHVAMNYRLGVFGFAQTTALRSEKSENAALRDQRLALEWVRDNIAAFGGDPKRVTIFGQSSGGVSVGMQMLAYGGKQPVPYQQGICQSQVLEPGITGNFTSTAMELVTDKANCTSGDFNSEAALACLRELDTETLLAASIATYQNGVSHNIGDIWLPSVDGDFLPDAPSVLVAQRRFAPVTTMMGWCEDDVTRFVYPNITTSKGVADFIASYAPDVSRKNIDTLLKLYPTDEFPENKTAGLSRDFYRTARIFRDIVMTCEPFLVGEHAAAEGADAYFFAWNQTIAPSALGVLHGADLPYVYANLSAYIPPGSPIRPTASDYELSHRATRSWSTFGSTKEPSLPGHNTFKGFRKSFSKHNEILVFVAGGPNEGLSNIDDHGPHSVIGGQKLRERCNFINSPEMIHELRF